MNRSLRRRLERAARASRLEPEVDISGMDVNQYMIHAIDRHGLEALVKDLPPLPVELASKDREEIGKVGAPAVSEAADAERSTVTPEPPAPPAAKPEPQWWEELCRWRMRDAEDLSDDDFNPYVVDNGRDYDPLERALDEADYDLND
jgi:hypothetical protein